MQEDSHTWFHADTESDTYICAVGLCERISVRVRAHRLRTSIPVLIKAKLSTFSNACEGVCTLSVLHDVGKDEASDYQAQQI